MQTKLPPASIGQDRHRVTFEAPGPPIPDGEGGYTESWTPLTPATWWVRIRPASARDAEAAQAGTVITHASQIVHGRFHPGVTTATRMVYRGRTYQVTSVINVDTRDQEMELVADLQS